jgi:hypothetical protein
MKRILCELQLVLLVLVVFGSGPIEAQSTLAEGFSKLPQGAKLVMMPADVELFQLNAGGDIEPRADWTAAAATHVREGLRARKARLGAQIVDVPESADEQFVELNRLHGAVATAIVLHHFGMLKLPTKDGKLDWSLGPEVAAIRQGTGADFAFFTWIRDSYATGGRVAAIIVGALLGVGMPGGIQQAYSSLVDLRTGRIVWFNRILRPSGDLRESEKAQETLDALLEGFPR